MKFIKNVSEFAISRKCYNYRKRGILGIVGVYLFCYYNHAAVFLISITYLANRYNETNNK